MTETLTAEQAESLEAAFLGGLEEAQFAYERIVETEAWLLLGFDRLADWWDERVKPTMRALSMRPTKEIAHAVVEQVRKEEAALPPAQRRTQRELADMVGVHPDTISGRKRQDPDKAEVPPTPDLEEPKSVELPKHQQHANASLTAIDEAEAIRVEVAEALDKFVPDPDAPRRQWQLDFITALGPGFKLMARFPAEDVAEQADDECLDELARLADAVVSYRDRVRAARPTPNNVRHLRAVS